jgi:hypothetical protein
LLQVEVRQVHQWLACVSAVSGILAGSKIATCVTKLRATSSYVGLLLVCHSTHLISQHCLLISYPLARSHTASCFSVNEQKRTNATNLEAMSGFTGASRKFPAANVTEKTPAVVFGHFSRSKFAFAANLHKTKTRRWSRQGSPPYIYLYKTVTRDAKSC